MSNRKVDNRRRDGLAQNSRESVANWSLDPVRAPLLGNSHRHGDVRLPLFRGIFGLCGPFSPLAPFPHSSRTCLCPWRVRMQRFSMACAKSSGVSCVPFRSHSHPLTNTPSIVPGCDCGSLGGLCAKCAWHVHVHVTEQRMLNTQQAAEKLLGHADHKQLGTWT